MKRVLSFLVVAVGIFILSSPAYAVYLGEMAVGGPEFVPGQILVKFREDATPSIIRGVNERQKAAVKKVIKGIDVHVLKFSQDIPVEEMVGRYRAEVSVEYAEPDYIARAMETKAPNDTMYKDQWGLNNTGQTGGRSDADIDAPEGWFINTGSSATTIAVVDTGISPTHEDITGKLVPGYNTIDDSANTYDDNGHGTHVAGIASANTDNSKGIAGVCWGCGLMPVKVLNKDGSGTYSDVSYGIVWAVENGAKVINLSLGGFFSSTTLLNAVNYAWNKGAILSCAAGNSGSAAKLYPAYYTNCIAVAATDQNDAKPWWSTFGKWVDVAAPGASILSTVGDTSEYRSWSGTSMATPHVAGLAGLLYSTTIADTNKNGRINDEVRAAIENNCDKIPGTGKYWAKGRINACKALGGGCTYSTSNNKKGAKGVLAGKSR